MAIWTRVDPDKLYQPFRRLVNKVLDKCESDGHLYIPTSGIRTMEEQAELYGHGRNGDPRPVVTWAPPGYSPHCWGIAIDAVRDIDVDKPGVQPDWRPEAYRPLADVAKTFGLEAGLDWPANKRDADHLQLNLEQYTIEWSDLIEVHKAGGYDAVFDFLDKFDWGA